MGDAKSQTILPADNGIQEAPRIIIEPSVSGPGQSFFVFNGQGYDQVVAPWAVEEHTDQHIGPAKAAVSLGDVPSWVAYVKRYHLPERLLLTWNENGLHAVLDAHQSLDAAGRGQWTAAHPFVLSDQWATWRKFANGETSWSQLQTVAMLDKLADDIVDPVASEMLDIIRTLRVNVKLAGKSAYLENGSTELSYSKDSAVVGKKAIPSEITINVPVLKGHVSDADRTIKIKDEQGQETERVIPAGTPVRYGVTVKVRPSVDDDGRVSFLFLMPTAERVLETVYADRVQAAKDLLGKELAETLYRAAS